MTEILLLGRLRTSPDSVHYRLRLLSTKGRGKGVPMHAKLVEGGLLLG